MPDSRQFYLPMISKARYHYLFIVEKVTEFVWFGGIEQKNVRLKPNDQIDGARKVKCVYGYSDLVPILGDWKEIDDITKIMIQVKQQKKKYTK